jgi:hypothetical protein
MEWLFCVLLIEAVFTRLINLPRQHYILIANLPLVQGDAAVGFGLQLRFLRRRRVSSP